MKNLAIDIIELINFIRPTNDPILKDKIFSNEKYGYLLKLKDDGKNYFKKWLMVMFHIIERCTSFIIYKQVDMGIIQKI